MHNANHTQNRPERAVPIPRAGAGLGESSKNGESTLAGPIDFRIHLGFAQQWKQRPTPSGGPVGTDGAPQNLQSPHLAR